MTLIKITKTITRGGKTFIFKMTCHLRPDGSRSGYDKALEDIADAILNKANEIFINLIDPLWYISNDFRLWRIDSTNPLWRLLDSTSQNTNRNWLIFRNHPIDSNTIEITHFGPFGTTNDLSYNNDWLKCFQRFKNDQAVANFIHTIKYARTESEKARAKTAFQNHLHANYIKAKSRLNSNIEEIKAKLINIVTVVFGVTEATVVITANLTKALAPSALKIGCKVLLKETTTIISRKIIQEISIITSKIAAEKSGKVIGKKIPGIGLAIGVGLAFWRMRKGDYSGASLELMSGAASTVPFYGTVGSLAIDGVLAIKDVSQALANLKHHQFLLERLSSALEILMDQLKELEEQNNLIMEVFFKGKYILRLYEFKNNKF